MKFTAAIHFINIQSKYKCVVFQSGKVQEILGTLTHTNPAFAVQFYSNYSISHVAYIHHWVKKNIFCQSQIW